MRFAFAVSCFCLAFGAAQTRAQDFFLTVTHTPDPILVGSNITYSVSVSNATGENLNPGILTSEYSTNAEFVSATNLYGLTNAPGVVVFEIPSSSFPANGVIDVQVILRGTNVGLLTNTFIVAIDDAGRTTPATNSVVSSIELPPEADLGISILGPVNGVFPEDEFSYQLLATNAGPADATGVVVSNVFPANVSLISLTPSDSVRLTNGLVLFTPGTLTNQASSTAIISVLATNAAVTNLISAKISAADITDTNISNNSYTTNVPILTPNANQFSVVALSSQELNQQTGWIEQRVVLQNVSTSSVDSVRLLVEGLTNLLVNATGTNGTTPYVAHGTPVAGGAQLELILEYSNPARIAGADPVLTAYGTPPLDLTPETGTGITIDRVVQINSTNINDGRVLLEWPASSGARFQVIYDEQISFTNARGSQPLVTAPPSANGVQWLDYGPPRTLTAPSNAPSRFYKVIELP